MNRFKRQILAALTSQLTGGKASPPEGAFVLWGAFYRLSRARTWHQHGPNPISYQEIEGFCQLNRLPLEPRHIEVLAAMDEVWIRHANETLTRAKTGKGQQQTPAASKHPLTATLFDAMFS